MCYGYLCILGVYHVDNPMPQIEQPIKSKNMEENVDKWDAQFIDLDDQFIYEITNSANYLIIHSLIDLSYPL